MTELEPGRPTAPAENNLSAHSEGQRPRPLWRTETGGWRISLRIAISRKLAADVKRVRITALVTGSAGWLVGAGVVTDDEMLWARGRSMGTSGEASGVISSGRALPWANDWFTSPLSARCRVGSADFAGVDDMLDRPRAPRREVCDRVPRGAAPESPRLATAGRESFSMITRASSDLVRRSRSPPERSFEPGAAQRAAVLGSADAVKRSLAPRYRAGPLGPNPPAVLPLRPNPSEGLPLAGRAGNGWASRFRSAVSAQTARNANGTINWMISKRILATNFLPAERFPCPRSNCAFRCRPGCF